MPDHPATEPHGLDPAAVDACAQGFVAVMRQVEQRHGDGAVLNEGAGCIRAAVLILDELCGPACVAETATWFGARAAEHHGPEATMPPAFADDGLTLPEPRTIGAAARHVVRGLRQVAATSYTKALEAACGALRAGVCIVREKAGSDVLAALLGHYAGLADTLAEMDGKPPAAFVRPSP